MRYADKWVVVDLDGTLCDIAHRKHLAQAREWEEFHNGIPNDKPHPHILDLLRTLDDDYNLIAVTGRPERNRTKTLNWMKANGECDGFFERLLMRPENDYTADNELKVRLIDEFFGSREKALEKVAFALDDRDRVVQSMRDAGFKVLQVAEGDY